MNENRKRKSDERLSEYDKLAGEAEVAANGDLGKLMRLLQEASYKARNKKPQPTQEAEKDVDKEEESEKTVSDGEAATDEWIGGWGDHQESDKPDSDGGLEEAETDEEIEEKSEKLDSDGEWVGGWDDFEQPEKDEEEAVAVGSASSWDVAESHVEPEEDQIPEEALRRILCCLRFLFNTETGIMGWVPTAIGIIISVEFFVYFFHEQEEYFVSESNVRVFLEKHARTSVDYKSEAFRSAILQTPFRPQKNNKRAFVICEAKIWKSLLAKFSSRDPPISPESYPRSIGQNFATSEKKKLRVTGIGWINKSTLKNIPSFGVKWWEDLFCEQVKEFM